MNSVVKSGIVYGYHGCDEAVANRILGGVEGFAAIQLCVRNPANIIRLFRV